MKSQCRKSSVLRHQVTAKQSINTPHTLYFAFAFAKTVVCRLWTLHFQFF
jgi:hypothetical protein